MRGLPRRPAGPSFAGLMPRRMPARATRRHVRRHRVAGLLAACIAGCVASAACSGSRDRAGTPDIVARLDSSAPRTPVEGGKTGGVAGTAAPDPPVVTPAAESARVIDERFQALRSRVNAEARALDTLPPATRLTPAYAARYDSLRAMTLHADSLRQSRDRWRAVAVRH